MTRGLKPLLSIALVFLAMPSMATDYTYKDYSKASDAWKRGFVLGISQYMSTVAQPDEEAPYPLRSAYERCLGASTDAQLVRQVETYVARNPASTKEPMVRVVIRSLFELCRSEIEKARPSKPSPGGR